MKSPFSKAKKITRYELPAYERKGYVAHQIASNSLVFVTFNQTYTDFEYEGGLPVGELGEKIKNCVSGVWDCTAVGYIINESEVSLVDVLVVNKKSVRSLSWNERWDLLNELYNAMKVDAKEHHFMLARMHERALVRMFDMEMKADPRSHGLLLRKSGKANAVICVNKEE